ncbi:DUF6056 family protein [Bradyrhizobium diazoefficiens]|uniref:DUF6056 family protein n=1 Tax=Bradyrhizobium diazoefficiens TaxID=1355477 RepID=UPI0027149EB8|nr:DUF6056 family protein [Bradyrhizobium diazoefficiens]WLA53187.1 DUF6056 family protein [Bradyrhizobium diazoefficiens]
MHANVNFTRTDDRDARLKGAAWTIVAVVAGAFILKLLSLALYSIPESDDFCFFYTNNQYGILGTVSVFYYTAIGRITPLLLMQLPAVVSTSTGIDLFICYVLIIVAFMVAFVVAMIFLTRRIQPDTTLLQRIALGLAFAAVLVSEAPSLHQMFYWLPGVACYTVPAAIVVLVFAELINATENGAHLSRASTALMAFGGLVAAMCNEFTAVWLIGVVSCSLLARWVFGQRLQVDAHLWIGLATVTGLAFVLSAPGNSVRMSQFPTAGDFLNSLKEAFLFGLIGLGRLFREPATGVWLLFVVLVSTALPQPKCVSSRKRKFLAAGVALIGLGGAYFGYFVHQYATGARLVERAQNEVLVFVLFSLTMSIALFARAFRDQICKRLTALLMPVSVMGVAVPLVFGASLAVALNYSKVATQIRSERDSFSVFWLESLERHARLTLSPEQRLVVAQHTVHPTTLMSSDVTDNPGRLPNDCIARFYQKESIMAGPTGTPSVQRAD